MTDFFDFALGWLSAIAQFLRMPPVIWIVALLLLCFIFKLFFRIYDR